MPGRFFVLGAAAVVVAAFSGGRANAHDLQGRVTILPDAIRVEAWFSDDTPAQEASVAIVDLDGKEVVAGRTDEKGLCRFGKLAPGKYTAVIELIGHRETIAFEESGKPGALEFSSWRLNKTAGIIGGLTILLGVSCVYCFVRKRRTAFRANKVV